MFPLHKYIRNKAGFSLVEVVVTMGLMIFLTASVSTVYVKTLRVYGFNQDRAKSTGRVSLGLQRMVDELQASDGIRLCTTTIIEFSSAGTINRYRITANELRRYPAPITASYYQVVASYIKTPTATIGWGFTCEAGTVTIKLTSYNPAYSATLSTNTAGYFEATVTPRGIPKNLAAWWKFDEGTGTNAYDLGGRFATGIGPGGNSEYAYLAGNSTWTTGIDNGAVNIQESYVSMYTGMYSGELDNGQSYTISMWFNSTTLPAYSGGAGTWDPLFGASSCGSGLLVASDALIYWDGAQGSPSYVNVTVTTGVWHHIAFTFENSDADSQGAIGQVYLDGVLKSTFSPLWTAENGGCYYDTIGGDYNSRFFDGKLDDVRFYNAVLSADEIAKLARYLPYYSSSTDAIADILTDTSNCGAIGTVCSGGTPSCVRGKCCATGQINCSGTCVTASSTTANCGGCGNNCAASGKVCTNGYCCTSGLTNCVTSGLATCVNTASNTSNCGSCSNACTGTTPACCTSVCADLDSAAENCGTCGTNCKLLYSNYGCCSGSCFDLDSDDDHCGDCDTACTPGKTTCISASCQ